MNECSICLIQNIPENEKCINNCGHSFCKPCLDGWFNTGKYSCPLCIQQIQYFKYNRENYRVIKPVNNNINTSRIRTNNLDNIRIQFINTKRKYIYLLFILTIISAFFVQFYFIYELDNNNKDLKKLYNTETTKYINIINENNLIDVNNMINIKMFYPKSSNCSIPFYYFNKC